MQSKRWLRCTLPWSLALLLASPLLYSESIKLPVPKTETLSNGLQLVWFVDQRFPLLDLVVLSKSGYKDDPIGKTGTVELLTESLDRGSDGMSAQDIARSIESLGASRYISGDDDTMTVGIHGLALDADKLLNILSKIILKPDFPEAEIKKEQARMIERWDHLGDYGETMASVAFRRAITAGTHYGRGSFLSKVELRSITRDDILAFTKKHFTPKNSVFMIVGQVDPIIFRKKIENFFSSWSGEIPQRDLKAYSDARLQVPPGHILIINRPSLNQAQLRIGFKSPLYQSPDHFALTVANSLLGEYFNSRLNALIRDKLGLTYAISSGFSYYKDFAQFSISSAARNENIGQLLKKSLETLQGLKDNPITEEEVQTAKNYLIGGFPLSVSTLGAIASRWLSGHIFDLGPEYLNEFISKVDAVNWEQVKSTAIKHLLPPNAVTIVIAGDAQEIEKSLKNHKYTKFKKISIDELI